VNEAREQIRHVSDYFNVSYPQLAYEVPLDQSPE
jgi:hypothetical protein